MRSSHDGVFYSAASLKKDTIFGAAKKILRPFLFRNGDGFSIREQNLLTINLKKTANSSLFTFCSKSLELRLIMIIIMSSHTGLDGNNIPIKCGGKSSNGFHIR